MRKAMFDLLQDQVGGFYDPKRKRFCSPSHQNCQQHVVAYLGDLPGTAHTGMKDICTHDLQQRARAG